MLTCRKPKVFLLFFWALCAAGVLPAEDLPPAPKVALVLSGGAALGFAHVGFLKVLEEWGIPVDLVIGNSMGSLVGALYAAGYSPGDIEAAASHINWAYVFLNEGSDETEGLQKERKPLYTLTFDHTGIDLMRGLLPDQNITLLFSRLVYRVSMQENFTALPLPFKTIAVDIANGVTVPLEEGALYRAMRSSMSIPLIFPPVPLNESYLVDGAILDNNPVGLALAWGADIIIDVDVGSFVPRKPEEINGIGVVADQTLRLIQSKGPVSETGSGGEIYRLVMDLSGFSWMDFAKSQAIIDRGEALARSAEDLAALAEKIQQLRPLEVRDWRRRGTYQDLADPVFSRVRLVSIGSDALVEREDAYQAILPQKYIDSLFDKFCNKPVDFPRLETAIEILRRRGEFENVGYHLEQASGGEQVLVLTGVRNRKRKNALSVYLDAEIAWGSDSQAKVSPHVDFSFRDIFFPNSRLSTGLSYRFSSIQGPDFYLALNPFPLFMFALQFDADGGYYASSVQAFQPDGDLSTFGFLNTGSRLTFSPAQFLEMSVLYRYSPLWYDEKRTGGISYYGDLHSAGFSINYNTLNVTQPLWFGFLYNSKWQASVELPFAGSRFDTDPFLRYERLTVYGQKLWTLRPGWSFVTDASAESYRGEFESEWTLVTLVGKNGIPGYTGTEFMGRDKLIAGFTCFKEIKPLSNLLNVQSFFAFTIRGGNVWRRLDSFDHLKDLRGGIRTGLQFETPVGSIFAGPEASFDGKFQFCIYFN
jgi:NTE family protein